MSVVIPRLMKLNQYVCYGTLTHVLVAAIKLTRIPEVTKKRNPAKGIAVAPHSSQSECKFDFPSVWSR